MLMFPEVTAAAVVAFHVIFFKRTKVSAILPVFPQLFLPPPYSLLGV